MKLRPFFILADLKAGGAQRVILTIVRHLNRQEFEPHLGIINRNGPLIKEIPENVHIHDLKASRVRYALPGILSVCHYLKPEIIVSTLGHLNLLLLAFKSFLPKGSRLVVREANTPSIRLRYTRRPSLYRFLYRRLYPLADGVICNSQYMKNDLVDSFFLSTEKALVIPNPVDSERIDYFLLNSHTPFRPGRYHIVTVGRLNYQKGFDLLLKVLKKALQKVPELHLSIIGDGSRDRALKDLAGDLKIKDFVTFVGHQDNPFPFMAHADLFISSSRWEGLPNVVLEALACGTPVLAFDCPGGTGEIIRQGENGWLVPSGDLESMSQKMVEIIEGKKWMELPTDSLLPREYKCQGVVRKYEEMLLSNQL